MRFEIQARHALPLILLAVFLLTGATSMPMQASGRPASLASSAAGAEVESAAQELSAQETYEMFDPVQFTAGLNSLPTVPAWKPGDPIKEIPRRRTVPSALEHTPWPRGFGMDPLAEAQARAPVREDRTFSSSSLNFAGHDYTGVNPSDPVGDVGLNYYVQMVNGPSGAIVTWYNQGHWQHCRGTVLPGHRNHSRTLQQRSGGSDRALRSYGQPLAPE